MNNTTPYDSDFFRRNHTVSLSSAQRIVPLLLESINPQSVVDVGCGDGTWLSEFYNRGIKDILGLDGDYVGREKLLIPNELFQARDLRSNHEIPRTFDLALSMEVAEHLPKEIASAFVQFLCKLAPVVLFSAAIPGQTGVNHVNEQWQSYWVDQFATQEFAAVDCIRPQVWTQPQVAVWYAQNTMLYIRKTFLARHSKLEALSHQTKGFPVDLVHPRLFTRALERNARSRRRGVGTRLRRYLRCFFGSRSASVEAASKLSLP